MSPALDHLLFLAGGDFFLYRMQHIAIYVSPVAVGHSPLTCWLGRILQYRLSQLHHDADHRPIRGVARRWITWALYQRWFGFQTNTRSRHLDLWFVSRLGAVVRRLSNTTSPDGVLVPETLLAFNVGVGNRSS